MFHGEKMYFDMIDEQFLPCFYFFFAFYLCVVMCNVFWVAYISLEALHKMLRAVHIKLLQVVTSYLYYHHRF